MNRLHIVPFNTLTITTLHVLIHFIKEQIKKSTVSETSSGSDLIAA